jgi:undecaprenyl-diphosphatase
MQDLTVKDALIVGFAQCLALIPGSSRSGSTIMGGLFAGEARDTAARFSFLLSIPAIAASGLLEMKEALHRLPQGSLAALRSARHLRHRRLFIDLVPASFSCGRHTTGVFIGLPADCRGG